LKGAATEFQQRLGHRQSSFTDAQIETEDTGLGRPVLVPLLPSTDVGGERFGFFLPLIDVAAGQTAYFHSVGIYETFSGPDSVPHLPTTWRALALAGTAQSVIEPL
jgi:hypothetical protein